MFFKVFFPISSNFTETQTLPNICFDLFKNYPNSLKNIFFKEDSSKYFKENLTLNLKKNKNKK